MTFALGVALEPRSVGVATCSAGVVADGPPDQLPPVIFVDGDRVVVGAEALALAASRPQSLVDDVVGQFTEDRLFLTGGRMLTADDALRELLKGVLHLASSAAGNPPDAVTIACPPSWGPEVLQRAQGAAESAGLPRPAVIAGLDPAAAAGEAWTRLPVLLPVGTDREADLPDLRSGVRGPDLRSHDAVAFEPHRTETGRQRRATLLSLCVVAALATVVAAVWIAGRDEEPATPSTTSSPPRPSSAPEASAPPRPLTLGLLTNGASEPETRMAVGAINAAGGLFGQQVQLVVEVPAAAAVGEATSRLLRAGATAVVTDLPAGAPGYPYAYLEQVIATSAGEATPVCATDVVADTPAGVAFVGTVGRCTELFALAAQSVRSTDAAPIVVAAREIAAGSGLDCTTYGACRDLIDDGQVVAFRPIDGSVRPMGSN